MVINKEFQEKKRKHNPNRMSPRLEYFEMSREWFSELEEWFGAYDGEQELEVKALWLALKSLDPVQIEEALQKVSVPLHVPVPYECSGKYSLGNSIETIFSVLHGYEEDYYSVKYLFVLRQAND